MLEMMVIKRNRETICVLLKYPSNYYILRENKKRVSQMMIAGMKYITQKISENKKQQIETKTCG